MIDREHVFGLRNEAGRVAGILGRHGGGFQRLHGRAGCAREVRGMTLGGGTPTGGWLARFSRRHSLSASCNAEHVAVRRAYVRHDYAFTPLPLPLYLVPDCSLLLSLPASLFRYLCLRRSPHPWLHLLRPLSFCSSTSNRRLLGRAFRPSF